MAGQSDSSSTSNHPKGPTIPVRMNRRTTLKPLSQLQGDNLPLLKKIRTSELTQRVRGHNASEEYKMKRLLNQWYTDQQWQIEKIHKHQEEVYQQLARIHNERRELQRTMYIWHMEEERTRRVLDEESNKVIAESQKVIGNLDSYRRLSLFPSLSRKPRMSLNGRDLDTVAENGTESPNLFYSRRSIGKSPIPMSPKSSITPADIDFKTLLLKTAEIMKPAAPILPVSSSPVREEDKSGRQSVQSSRISEDSVKPPPRKPPSRSVVMKAKVLQVNRSHPLQPIVRERSKEILRDELTSTNLEVDAVDFHQSLPSHPPESEAPPFSSDFKEQTQLIEEIKRANKIVKIKTPHTSISSTVPAIPTIKEDADDHLALWRALGQLTQPPPMSSSSLLKKSHSPTLPLAVPVAAAADDHSLPAEDDDLPPSPEAFLHSLAPRKSLAQLNRHNRKLRERLQQQSLEEPFTAYRRDARGNLVAMENLPTAFPTEEPSNKDKFKTDKILKTERSHFIDNILKLQNFTAEVVAEEERNRELRAQIKVEVVQEKKVNTDLPSWGPEDWKRVFIHSNIPKGMDPDSPEALKYCRYIRRPEPQNIDLLKALSKEKSEN